MQPPIEWHTYLLRCLSLPEFNLSSNFILTDSDEYKHWTKSASDLSKDVIHAGLKLTMENHGALEKRATAAEEAQNHFLTVEAARRAYNSQQQGSSANPAHEPTAMDFEETINLHMESLYKAHPPNGKYEKTFPIYIEPCNPCRYILLTGAAIQTWAQALNIGTPGVTLTSPPSSLQFVNISSKKRKLNASIGSSSSEMGQILAHLLSPTDKRPDEAHSNSGQSSGFESDSNSIIGYLDFVKIQPPKKQEVLDILNKNDIDSFKMFNSGSIPKDRMLQWGLSDGIVAHLRDNVSKYKRFIKTRKSS